MWELIIKYRAPLLALLVCLGCFGLGWHVKAVFDEAATVELQKKFDAIKEQAAKDAAAASAELAKVLATQRAKNDIINQKLEAQVAKNSVYSSCKLPVDGVRFVNQAVAAGKTSR